MGSPAFKKGDRVFYFGGYYYIHFVNQYDTGNFYDVNDGKWPVPFGAWEWELSNE
jgi:hypothetical protein